MALTDEQTEQYESYLRRAAIALDGRGRWRGYKASRTQARAWPRFEPAPDELDPYLRTYWGGSRRYERIDEPLLDREVIPEPILQAQALLAYKLFTSKGSDNALFADSLDSPSRLVFDAEVEALIAPYRMADGGSASIGRNG